MNKARMTVVGGSMALALILGGSLMAAGMQPGDKDAPKKKMMEPATVIPAAGAYKIDPVHSNVIFKIKHMGASNFYGRFDKTMGTFTLGDTAEFDVTVGAESVDTNNSKRDDHVRSADFLSASEFPTITFKAKGLARSGDSWKGKGELTVHGVAKGIEVEIKQVGTGKGMDGKDLAGVESTFTIKRTDFGVKGLVGPVGDDVVLMVSLEGGK